MWQALVDKQVTSKSCQEQCLFGVGELFEHWATLPVLACDGRGSPVKGSLHWGQGVWLGSHPGLVHGLAQGWDQCCWYHHSDNPVSVEVSKALFLSSVNGLSVKWDLKHKQCFSRSQEEYFNHG